MLTAKELQFSRDPWLPPTVRPEAMGAVTRFVLGMKPGESIVCRRPKYYQLKDAAYRRSIPWEGKKLGRGNYQFKRLG